MTTGKGPLPAAFVRRMQSLLGTEVEAFFAALKAEPHTGLRVNTLKLNPDTFDSLSPFSLTPVPWCPSGFTVADAEVSRPGLHPYHAAGLYYLQEPSAMAVAEVLAPRPGEWVLDLAAAPGGKTTHLSALMKDSGLLVANEIHPGRLRALGQNLERWGTRRGMLCNEAPARLAGRWGAVFDRVLLDAPCSGEGMFRKSAEALADWSEATIRGCARRQSALLLQAADLVRPGGRLAYSTCTFAPEENEQVIAEFLSDRDDFELESLAPGSFSPGRPEWVSDGSAAELSLAGRLWPHKIAGEGHFIALFRSKPGETPARRFANFRPLEPRELSAWRGFVAEHLHADPFEDMGLTRFGKNIFAVPLKVPEVRGLKVRRTGLWLGHVRDGRFLPSHSLALSLAPKTLRQRQDFEPDDPELLRYLQGHALERPGPEGWVLLTVSGHGLAWARRSGAKLNNRLPKGLRRL